MEGEKLIKKDIKGLIVNRVKRQQKAFNDKTKAQNRTETEV